jgi:hypothetical protein
VVVKYGLFSVLLGSVNPVPASVFDGSIKYLGVQVESDPELRPLTPIVSVAYAYRAGDADIDCEDCDERFVNVEGPDSIAGSAPRSMLKVTNYSNMGSAIMLEAPNGGAGLYVNKATVGVTVGAASYAGVWSQADVNGLHVARAGEKGLYVGRANQGVYIDSAYNDGVHVSYAGKYGLHVVESDSDAIVIGSAKGIGLDVGTADLYGVQIGNAGWHGVRIGNAGWDGLSIQRAGDDGLEIDTVNDCGLTVKGGGELSSLSDTDYGLRVNSNGESPTNPGLYVAGTAHSTGGWSTKLSGSSGDVTAFSVVSRNVEVIASGTGILVDGQAEITFDQEFQEAVSSEIPVKVVFAAQGAPSGLLYVESKSNRGFAVRRLEIPDLAMKSGDITFDWIALGRQKGHEETPKVLIPSDEEMRVD